MIKHTLIIDFTELSIYTSWPIRTPNFSMLLVLRTFWALTWSDGLGNHWTPLHPLLNLSGTSAGVLSSLTYSANNHVATLEPIYYSSTNSNIFNLYICRFSTSRELTAQVLIEVLDFATLEWTFSNLPWPRPLHKALPFHTTLATRLISMSLSGHCTMVPRG